VRLKLLAVAVHRTGRRTRPSAGHQLAEIVAGRPPSLHCQCGGHVPLRPDLVEAALRSAPPSCSRAAT